MNFFWIYLAIGIVFLGCSNAPPNLYQLPRSGFLKEKGISLTPRFPLPNEGKTYRSFTDSIPLKRADGEEAFPEYSNMFDFITATGYRRHKEIIYGLYMSNLYPGIFLGYNHRHLSMTGFLSGTYPGKKLLPGVQIFSDYKAFYLSYSIYRQNLGSSIPNPAWGYEGPYRIELAERYNLGFRPFRSTVGFGIGVFLDRTYWKKIFVSGFEIIISI